MAQWQALLQLDSGLQRQVSQLYEGTFSREIRHYLCHWIEKQNWDLAAVDVNTAISCFHALQEYLEELWKRSVQENKILQGPNFLNMKDSLVKQFQNEPQNLARILSHCLKEEKKILALAPKVQGCNNPGMEQNSAELDNKVSGLKQQTLEVKDEIKTLEDLYEQLDLIQKTWQSRVQQCNGLNQSRAAVEEDCLKRASFITQTKQIVLQQLYDILNHASQVVTTLTDVELPTWKHRQQMACIGSPVDTSLDHLQKWFTIVAEVIVGIREQLQKLQEQNNKYNCTDASSLAATMVEIEKFALSLLTKLLTNALVVEKQPVMQNLPQRPLVLKTGVGFKVKVRYLANHPEFKRRLKPVKPVFDKDVEEAKTVTGFRHFEFERDDKKVLDVEPPGDLIAEFRNMSLKERREKSKASCEGSVSPAGAPGVPASTAAKSRPGVTEELHIIKFVTELEYAGLKCNIEASSLPLVVVSSTAQVASAWASIMWCSMLSTSGSKNLSLFVDPPPLTWEQLAQVLSWQFLSVGQRELDEDQLSMLRDKIVDPDGLVHWSKFSSKNGSPWIWIDGILDLIKKHLVDLWRDGYIMGFVSRERTELLLKPKKPGTFLLRFSETNKDGAISFSWVDHSNGEPHVHAVQPYRKKELLSMSLPDLIYHYILTHQGETRNPLLYLYPDIHIDTAFRRYYKILEVPIPNVSTDGYVGRKNTSVSIIPTPPPSPPTETFMMDIDTDVDTCTDHRQVMEDLFPDLLDSPGQDVLTSTHLYPQLPQDNFALPLGSFEGL
ncbi:signal transducer and activator of transcription 1-alpha/beta-like [Amphiprion ocellaris]|uniref:Signal transducer and activator of transcription n=1 Tax=Amphiprion ocellaris TaxID=80972 RepID=A0AAQ5ZKM0_AMPOC|nr:signal transducer and activator of transcription 1-alpha/beta-like [Amphiprion ocellaris]